MEKNMNEFQENTITKEAQIATASTPAALAAQDT
jgi:hypothetical protein